MSSPTGSQSNINLEQQRKRAKDLLRAHKEGKVEAAVRIARHLPRARNFAPENLLAAPFTLSEAQFVVAREAGFSSWPNLKRHVEGAARGEMGRSETLIDAALAGNEAAIAAARERDPVAPQRSIYVAAALADSDAALALLRGDPSLADRPGGRRAWKPLLYLCSSRRRLDQSDAARVLIARRLLEMEASVTGRDSGFRSTHGTMLSEDNELFAIEAAAGRSASPELVQVLLSAGANLKETTVALLQAVRGGNIEVLKLLLAALPSEVLWQVGWALQESVVLGNKDMARLLAGRADLPAEAALLEAIRLGRDPEMLEILLGDNSTSARSRRVAQKAYRHAVRYGHHAAIALLGRLGADDVSVTAVDRLLGACVNGDDKAMRALLKTSRHIQRFLVDEDHHLLSWAIRNSRHYAVPLLLEAGLDPNVPDTDGETPLHLAVRSGGLGTMDLLIHAAANVDGRNFDAQTPLEIALSMPDPEVRGELTRRLLDLGASPARMSQFRPETGRTHAPIEEELRQGGAIEREDPDVMFERAADAVVFGDLEAIRTMLDEEPFLAHARSPRPHRATLLHYCGANGVEEPRQRTPGNAPAIMQLLLDRGSDVNATCSLYRGAATTIGLLLSSIHPLRAGLRTTLCEILLKAGASLDGARERARLSEASALGRWDLVKAFLDDDERLGDGLMKGQIQSAFMWACEFGRTSVVEFLLDKGADTGAQNQNGQTGLHLAALSGHLDTVRLLLTRYAPLEVLNAWGGTVLTNVLWAAVNHDPNTDYSLIVEALIGAGANVEPDYLTWWRQQKPLLPSAKPRIEELLKRRLGL